MRHRVRLLHLNDLLSRILPADLAFRGLLPKLGGDAVGFLFGNEPRLRVAILSGYWSLRRKFLNGWPQVAIWNDCRVSWRSFRIGYRRV